VSKRKEITQKEIASYQLALRCLRWVKLRTGGVVKFNSADVHGLAKEIRAYRNEERKVN